LQGNRHTRCNFCHETPPRHWTISISLKAISNLRFASEEFYRFELNRLSETLKRSLTVFIRASDHQNPDHDQSVSNGSIRDSKNPTLQPLLNLYPGRQSMLRLLIRVVEKSVQIRAFSRVLGG
jgi:hypothetical protein